MQIPAGHSPDEGLVCSQVLTARSPPAPCDPAGSPCTSPRLRLPGCETRMMNSSRGSREQNSTARGTRRRTDKCNPHAEQLCYHRRVHLRKDAAETNEGSVLIKANTIKYTCGNAMPRPVPEVAMKDLKPCARVSAASSRADSSGRRVGCADAGCRSPSLSSGVTERPDGHESGGIAPGVRSVAEVSWAC